MKFLIRDTGRTQLFDGQITTYDGLTGKYSVYFPCDGKTVYIYLDDKAKLKLHHEKQIAACTCHARIAI